MRKIILKSHAQIVEALRLIDELPLSPLYEVVIQLHKPDIDRTAAQNRLQFLWYNAISQQKEDMSPVEVRGYCKLHFGVGIVKSGVGKIAAQFTEQYDEIIRPLTYEQKLSLMTPPIELPVTSLMTVRQMTQYLEDINIHFSGEGIILPMPDYIYQMAMEI